MYATCLNIIHVWQPDEGFRPAMARNKAIAKATGEYIILVDGDMVLHPEFIADHLDFAQEGTFVQGKRILLDQKKTRTVLTENRSTLSHASWKGKNKILSALWSGRCYMRKLHGIKSCNMAFFRQDCLNVNGFNEDFIGWGREDSEFAARLLHSGVNRRDLSFAGIAYHLFHKECSRVMLAHNHNLYMQTLSLQSQYCKNGITVRS
jgi:glycosyltransferase involved in cell wall biosynthesis